MVQRNCLILGAGGFIGMNLSMALLRSGAELRAVGHRPSLATVDPAIHWVSTSFEEDDALVKAISWADSIFHLSGGTNPHSSVQNPVKDAEYSILHTLRILELARAHGKPRIIFASSGGAVYGLPERIPITETCREHPISAYGVSKLAIEKYLGAYRHLYGLPTISLRISNPYGPFQYPNRGQGLIAALISAALKKKPIEIWGTGEVVRDYIHIDDVVKAMIAASTYSGPHHLFNVGSGTGLSVNAVANAIDDLSLGEPLVRNYRSAHEADVPVNILDSSLIQREMNWHASVPLSSGLRDTATWIKTHVINESPSCTTHFLKQSS